MINIFFNCVNSILSSGNVSFEIPLFEWLWESFDLTVMNYYLLTALILSVMRPIYLLMNICSNYWKRKAEYAADQEAVSNGFGEDMISVMKKSCREEYKPINTNPY